MKQGRPETRDYDLISAMQKFIRRGMEEEAGQAFFEIVSRGFSAWALCRLQIIAHEDIGLGDPQALSIALMAIHNARQMVKKNSDEWRLPAANAILVLARAQKSREADHFQAAMEGRVSRGPIEIPDYCYDKHTRKGKSLGRGLAHFRETGAKLDRSEGDEYEAEAYRHWENQEGGPTLGLEMTNA